MAVIGLVTIPGTMTGQLLGGSPVDQAVKVQQIVMFMITASASIGTVLSVLLCGLVLVDEKVRIRVDDRVQKSESVCAFVGKMVVLVKNTIIIRIYLFTLSVGTFFRHCFCGINGSRNGESDPLLPS